MALYKAEFTVFATPMTLGDYCRQAGWYSTGRDNDTPGFYLKYQPSNKTGWIAAELFEECYRPIEVFEE